MDIQLRYEYRNLERISLKLAKIIKRHLVFIATYVINKLFSVYTNIRLHDNAARKKIFIEDFCLNLIKWQILKQKESILSLNNEYLQQLQKLKYVV